MEVRSVEAIVRGLNEANVQYLIVGGLAVIAHGYERLTRDVDLVIGLEAANIVKGLYALKAIGYQTTIPVTPEEFADEEKRESWRREKNMIVLKLWSDTHRRTPIDVFVYEPFDFAREYAAARWEPVFGSLEAPIVSYEALVAMKQTAGRPQDLADIADLARIQELKQTSLE
jgi:predicted nucleotidyltransferase